MSRSWTKQIDNEFSMNVYLDTLPFSMDELIIIRVGGYWVDNVTIQNSYYWVDKLFKLEDITE